jgi:type VI secretion system protein ImpI
MTLRLVIEHAPHPQPRIEVLHQGGEISIGRGTDADWQIVDPDMFVSRRHCVVAGRDGNWTVTDASRGGLFVDGADAPLGIGNSMPLEHGMRLRLGDVVIRVEMEGAVRRAAAPGPGTPPSGAASTFTDDDFFTVRPKPEPQPERPANLPESFDASRDRRMEPEPGPQKAPPLFDDPFSLDPLPSRVEPAPAGGTDFFAPTEAAPPADPCPATERVVERRVEMTAPAGSGATTGSGRQHDAPAADAAGAEAFFRGLGLASGQFGADPAAADMEALGRRFRALADGLLALLRARALEKRNVRVAQTVIGASDVNPLKFLPTTDEAIAALVSPRGAGYLPPDEAIAAAFRDLSDHQTRSWSAMQVALRRMIDRFDPAQVEAAVADDGMLQTLLAGGRGARLWQLYAERYREIAKAAEERFLGEVGADFRDAYEGNGWKDR